MNKFDANILKRLKLRPFEEIEAESKEKGVYPRASGRTTKMCLSAALTIKESPRLFVTVWGHTTAYSNELYRDIIAIADKLDIDTSNFLRTSCLPYREDERRWWKGKEGQENLWLVFYDHYRNEEMLLSIQNEIDRLLAKLKTVDRDSGEARELKQLIAVLSKEAKLIADRSNLQSQQQV